MSFVVPELDLPECYTAHNVAQSITDLKIADTTKMQKLYLEETKRHAEETKIYLEKTELQIKCLEAINNNVLPCKVDATYIPTNITQAVIDSLVKVGYIATINSEKVMETDHYNMDADMRSYSYRYYEVEHIYINIDNPMIKKSNQIMYL